MKHQRLILALFFLCFVMIAALAATYLFGTESNGVRWNRQSDNYKGFTLILGVEGEDFIVVGDELFRLTEVDVWGDDQHFILTHELGDGKHIIPLKVPFVIDYEFGLEGYIFKVTGYDGSCGAKRIILQHIDEAPR